MAIGKVIREVRLNKNIRAVDLYKNLLSKPAIMHFEKGVSDTTVNKFFTMLERLNITLEEFDFIFKKETNLDFYYTRNYSVLFYERDVDALSKLAAQAAEEFNETFNEKYKHYQAVILLLIDYLNDRQDNPQSLEVLQSYLASCDNWGYYEITLFTNSLIFYSDEYIDLFYSRVKKKMDDYQQLTRYRNELAILIFNILEKKILNKDILNIKHYINELTLLKPSSLDNMYVQSMITYFKAIATMVLKGEVLDGAKADVMKITDFLDYLGIESKSKQCMEFFEKVISLYELDVPK